MDEALKAAWQQIDALRSHDIGAARIVRLGGLTNRVFSVHLAEAAYCLRLPGQGTEAYIDRKVEATNAKAAAQAGVAPEVIEVDPASGWMLTRLVDDVVTMTPALFSSRDGAAVRAGRAFAMLHRSGQRFDFRFELFSMIDEYLGVLNKLGAALPEGYHATVEAAGRVRTALGAHPAALAPCHCDPLCENFLDTGQRMWIVDWEYSGMNDPMWDLGDLSVEGGFDEALDRAMLEAYLGGPAGAFDHGRMVIYKAMCDLLWTLWGLIQHANGNPAEDFWAYATGRLDRCRELMASVGFERHLLAIERGP